MKYVHTYSYILFSFVKLLFSITKIIIIMWKHKKIIRDNFRIVFLEKIKFEEM